MHVVAGNGLSWCLWAHAPKRVHTNPPTAHEATINRGSTLTFAFAPPDHLGNRQTNAGPDRSKTFPALALRGVLGVQGTKSYELWDLGSRVSALL